MMLPEFDRLIVETLTWRVRIISSQHIERLAKACGANQSRSIQRLIDNGYLTEVQSAAPILSLDKPLYRWRPGDKDCDSFGQVCWKAKSRMMGDKVELAQQILMATKKAADAFGGCGGKLRQPFQVAHDLGTASVFVAKVKQLKITNCDGWVGEDIIRRYYRDFRIRKIPDAAFLDRGQLQSVVDFVGRDYTKQTLTRFHLYWSRRQIPYELW